MAETNSDYDGTLDYEERAARDNARAARTLSVTLPVSRLRLMDLLCTAVEGGSNYWAKFRHSRRTADLDYLQVDVAEHEASGDGPPMERVVTAEDLLVGLQRLATSTMETANQHLLDAISEDGGDATTADVVLQMTVFGEVVYG